MEASTRPSGGGTFTKIVTHDDFDGIVSAALCSVAEGVDDFLFSGPGSILDLGLEVGPETIVCDLPHHPEAGRWFDHHVGNLEDYCLKGGDPEAVRETFAPEKSCARVIWRFYEARGIVFPAFLRETVDEADTIDSFDYRDIAEWRRETPGRLLSDTLRLRARSRQERYRYMRHLIRRVREAPLAEILPDPEVQEKIRQVREAEAKCLALIERTARFLDGDTEREIVVLDTTELRHEPNLIKSLAFLRHPEAKAVLEIKCLFRQRQKTNDLGISLSLSPCVDAEAEGKDVGEIMRVLNIGDGHRGAGAGKVFCRSKAERIKKKERLAERILELWKAQSPPPSEAPGGRDQGPPPAR